MRRIKMLLALVLILCANFIYAQSTISGTVTDVSTGKPLEGVTVKVKSTKIGTTTNANGMFTIKASSNDVLTFSYVGYSDQEVSVNGQSTISVKLMASITDLGQVVMVGTRSGGR